MLTRAGTEMQTYVNASLKTASDKLYERVVDDQNSVNLKFNQVLNETTQNLLNDWNDKYEQMNTNFSNYRRQMNQELESKLSSVQGNSTGNMDDINRAIDGVRQNW